MADISIKFDADKLKELAEEALNKVAVEQTGMTVQECIEKQIPTKPIKVTKDNYTVDICSCGCPVFCGIRYCPDCGQRLKWEVND